MVTNKDLALRAKNLAERLMTRNDFRSARRLASTVQSLDRSMENISRMITTVCDVHCAAEAKLFGDEKDWYGILQVEQNEDNVTIQEQYTKLALLLHPENNKLPGAEAAFKLIGEALRILLDREKRSLHDETRRTAVEPVPQHATVSTPQLKNLAAGEESLPVSDYTDEVGAENFSGKRKNKRKRKQIVESSESESEEDNDSITDQEGSTENVNAERAQETETRKHSLEDGRFKGTLPNGINRKEKIKEIAKTKVVASAGNSKDLDAKKDSGFRHSKKVSNLSAARVRFHNFDAEKSEEKLQAGDIWSVYGDCGLPKCYARIQKIERIQTMDREAALKLHVLFLKAKPFTNKFTEWSDEEMPVSCGTFCVPRVTWNTYTDITVFSHQIRPESSGKLNEYIIRPKTGDVWAIYKKWSHRIKVSDLEKCEYDVVEVLGGNLSYEVVLLERVEGFVSVFRVAKKQGCEARMTVSQSQLLRFSHQVPAFRLTEERNGTLRGFIELDPKALPRNLLTTS